ncbi:MAG: hypothetical protein CL927_01095 [Deltaproteobacteria bacterium]|nr:hypothetical protein [Deltaproteobacteria bacterium]HCH66984.1 hypothetical protein [Deltaproteobacteria bacterium]
MRPPSLVVRPVVCFAPLLSFCVACGGGDEVLPDGVWDVTVASLLVGDGDQQSFSSDCISEDEVATVYSKSFKYELYYDGEAVLVEIDGQAFGDGTRAGCNLVYESAVWLDERAGGQVTWYVEGAATYRGVAGGCDNQFPDGVDWTGTEVAIVVDSTDESVPVGCTYDLVTSGTVVSGG